MGNIHSMCWYCVRHVCTWCRVAVRLDALTIVSCVNMVHANMFSNTPEGLPIGCAGFWNLSQLLSLS